MFRKHLTLFVIALFVVLTIDSAIDFLTIDRGPSHPGPSWQWGATWVLPDSALSGAAAFNDTLTAIWFAETMAFILIPLVLIWFYQRLNMRFWIPWVLTGIVALFGIWANMDRVYSGYHSVSPPQFTETLHDGAYSPIHNGNKDYMLESEFGEFLIAQLLFVVPFTIGYLVSDHYESTKN